MQRLQRGGSRQRVGQRLSSQRPQVRVAEIDVHDSSVIMVHVSVSMPLWTQMVTKMSTLNVRSATNRPNTYNCRTNEWVVLKVHLRVGDCLQTKPEEVQVGCRKPHAGHDHLFHPLHPVVLRKILAKGSRGNETLALKFVEKLFLSERTIRHVAHELVHTPRAALDNNFIDEVVQQNVHQAWHTIDSMPSDLPHHVTLRLSQACQAQRPCACHAGATCVSNNACNTTFPGRRASFACTMRITMLCGHCGKG